MKEFLANLSRNPKTTAAGVISVLVWACRVWILADDIGLPRALIQALSEPGMDVLIVTAYLGLVGKDQTTTGTAAKPNPSRLNVTVEQKPDPSTVVIVNTPTETIGPIGPVTIQK